ncbi:MAG: AAA family ATPase [Candidatus Kapabacteria bacterium]|nr:AAA family ATPase [Candidatus Kapabacteria bacterium]
MRIKELHLTNIGPFNDAHLEFAADDAPRVTIITGENGTGKTIVLDAIRGLFGYYYSGNLGRSIFRQEQSFVIKGFVEYDNTRHELFSNSYENPYFFKPNNHVLYSIPNDVQSSKKTVNWVLDYWGSTVSNEGFNIKSLSMPSTSNYLMNSLSGILSNTDLTQYICGFDYIRTSEDMEERNTGKFVYQVLEKIFAASLIDGGKLDAVKRIGYMPIILQNGQKVPLQNLSSGNLYMIQRLVSLLSKMYAVHILRKTPPETLCDTPGLLLIDEAENHLHPKWQKRFIPTILDIFPNLQIIATTHSPFIVSSVEGAKVYVCKPHTDHCTIEDETDFYANKPVEEVLASPVFGTSPFGEEISKLLEERKKAINENNEQERTRIEARLKEENPQYFAYFDIDKRLEALLEGAEQ